MDRNENTSPYVRAAGVIMSRWIERHPADARVHFALPVTAPLLAFYEPTTATNLNLNHGKERHQTKHIASENKTKVNNSAAGDAVDDAGAMIADVDLRPRATVHDDGQDSDDDDDDDDGDDVDRRNGEGDCTKKRSPRQAKALVTEEAIAQCVSDLHALLVTSDPTAMQLLPLVRPVALPLLRMHAVAQRTLSHLRRPIEEVLCAYFSLLPEREAAAEFCRMLLPVADAESGNDGGVVSATGGHGTVHGNHGDGDINDGGDQDDDDDDAASPAVATQLDGTLVVRGLEPRSFAPGPTGGLEMRPSRAAEEHDLNRDAEAALALLKTARGGKMAADVFAVLVEMCVDRHPSMLESYGSTVCVWG
jgi:hypothetical protein